jgi:hypothetical protein
MPWQRERLVLESNDKVEVVVWRRSALETFFGKLWVRWVIWRAMQW